MTPPNRIFSPTDKGDKTMSNHAKPTNEESFERDVLQSDRPVLVDFHAEWCGPCHVIGPIIEEIAQDYAGRVNVRKVDVDENQGLAEQYGVRGIPTLLLFNDGQVHETVVGLQSKTQLAIILDRVA